MTANYVPMTVCGVPGGNMIRMTPGNAPHLWARQSWTSDRRPAPESWGEGAVISATLRFDDDPSNMHNTFSLTADIYAPAVSRSGRRTGGMEYAGGGASHDSIAAAFPELAHLIRWHLVSTDGPMHYLANAVFLAGDRDPWGRRAGEPSGFETAIVFGDNPICHRPGREKFRRWLEANRRGIEGPFDFEVIRTDHNDRGFPGKYQYGPKFTFGGFGEDWADCPFNSEQDAIAFLKALQTCAPRFVQNPTGFSEGKARNLAAARRAACWPEATDADLMAEPAELRATLQARLPALLAAFRADMESAGFLWSPETVAAVSEGA